MARQKTTRPPTPPTDDVAAFLARLDHPLRRDLETVRRIVLGVDRRIGEGIKWNAPSFRTDEWFATLFLRNRESVQLIFHRGAKVKDGTTQGVEIPDPEGLIEWVAKERCIVRLGAGNAIAKRRLAFERIVRAWIRTG